MFCIRVRFKIHFVFECFNCVIEGNLVKIEIEKNVFYIRVFYLLLVNPNNKCPLILKTTPRVYYLGGIVLGGKD